MKKIIFIYVLLIFNVSTSLYAQDQDSIKEQIAEADYLMDHGNIAQSKILLNKVLKSHPNHFIALYELGYAYYLEKQYTDAIGIYKQLEQHKDVSDLVYQMEGNAYDMSGDHQACIKTYDEGLKRFPYSGKLLLERGMMAQREKDFYKAIDCYEKGISGEPTFASNYYRAAYIFMNTNEPIWGLVYAEIMANLQPESDRAKEMCKQIFRCVKENITFDKNKKSKVNLTQQHTITSNPKTMEMMMPFPTVYELTFSSAVMNVLKNDTTLNLKAFCKIRENHLKHFFGLAPNTPDWSLSFKNILLEYQKKVMDAGHLEAYNMYLFQDVNPAEFSLWCTDHEKEYVAFKLWYHDNPITINQENKFVRGFNTSTNINQKE